MGKKLSVMTPRKIENVQFGQPVKDPKGRIVTVIPAGPGHLKLAQIMVLDGADQPTMDTLPWGTIVTPVKIKEDTGD